MAVAAPDDQAVKVAAIDVFVIISLLVYILLPFVHEWKPLDLPCLHGSSMDGPVCAMPWNHPHSRAGLGGAEREADDSPYPCTDFGELRCACGDTGWSDVAFPELS